MKTLSSVIIIVLSALLIFALIFSVTQAIDGKKSENLIYSSFDKSFYELLENVEKMELSLLKANHSEDFYQLLKLSSQIDESAAFAISDLGDFESERPLTNINTFLNQSGDYIKSVALSHSDGSRITDTEKENLKKLSYHATLLKNELSSLREKTASGEISYSTALRKADATLGTSLGDIEEKFSLYEKLSYNGALSGHMDFVSSGHLSSLPPVDSALALKTALSYSKEGIPLTLYSETGGNIPYFSFYYKGENASYSTEITKNGGKLLSLSVNRSFSDPLVGLSESINIAKSFLENAGFPSMQEVYYENSGTVLTLFFARYENDVYHYPDLITVEVALDKGEIVAFDASKYLMNLKSRIFPEISAKAETVTQIIRDDYGINSMKKTFLLSSYGKEIPCIELKFQSENKTFLTYINATSGRQEEIYILSETDMGRFVQ